MSLTAKGNYFYNKRGDHLFSCNGNIACISLSQRPD
jgi:hypothetical protein